MADGQYLVDGTDGQVSLNPRQTNATVEAALEAQAASVVALIEEVQTPIASRATIQTMSLSGPTPPGAGGGTNVYDPNGSSHVPPDYGTNLWLAQIQLTNGDLTPTNWGSTGRFLYGNWTAFTALPAGRTNRMI